MTNVDVLCVSADAGRRERILSSLVDVLEDVTLVSTADGAIERVESESCDCVVVDVESVFEVPDEIAAFHRETATLPTVVVREDAETAELLVSTMWPIGDDGATATAVARALGATESDERTESRDTSEADTTAGSTTDSNEDDKPATGSNEGDGSTAESVEEDVGASTRASTARAESTIDTVVDGVRRRIADATTAVDVERTVREELRAHPDVEFAWVGEFDPGERQVVPWVTDPDVDWPVRRSFSLGAAESELLERAMHSRTVQTFDDVGTSGHDVPLADAALDSGATSVTAVPLAVDEDLYGVIVVYAATSTSEAFRSGLEALGETVSNALRGIAAQSQVEQQARQLHRYERLVETAGDGMYVIDAEGHFTTVNETLLEMTGYSHEGLLGEHISLVIDEETVADGQDIIGDLLEGEARSKTMEGELRTKDGSSIPCEFQIAVLPYEASYHGSVGVIRDVTERKRRERALERQNERLEAFARIASHDLRNPLGIAQGFLELAIETDSTDQLHRVDDALGRMEEIIADVLALARSPEQVTDTEPIDLERLVEEAWSNVETASATLVVDDRTTLHVDRTQVLRMIENLFRNAVEHGGANVTVRVGALSGDGGFYVEDDGRGMNEEVRERAFESEYTTSEQGSGIGLWVVREVASSHGWSATVVEGDRGGARFEFAFDEE